jgi:hypothetical protein
MSASLVYLLLHQVLQMLTHLARDYGGRGLLQRPPPTPGHHQRPATCPIAEPITKADRLAQLNVNRHDRLGGILHEDEHAA